MILPCECVIIEVQCSDSRPNLKFELSNPKLKTRVFGDTFSAMQYPLFRRYWLGAFFSFIGGWVQTVAHGWLVYDLTQDKLLLGYVGFANALPMLGLGLFGGALVDRFDRRRLLLLTQSLFALSAAVLTALTLTQTVRYEHILLLALMNGFVAAVDFPARLTLVSGLVDKKDLANGIAMNAAAFQTARILGPALGGAMLEWFGAGYCFLLNSLSYLTILLAVLSIPADTFPRAAKENFRAGLLAGFKFVYARRGLFTMVCNVAVVSMFGLSYMTLMPVFAEDVFKVGKTGLGQLFTAAGIGSLLGLLLMARFSESGHRGWSILIASLGFGLSLLAFSLTTPIWLAKLLLVFAGMFGVMQLAGTNTALQTRAPDELRGRVVSLHAWAINAPAPFASLLAGKLAQQFDAPFAVRVGALACIGMGLFMLFFVSDLRKVK